MSSNDDDRLRLLSDAEREAMEAEEDEYDPEAENAAALAALGRGPLDEGDDDDDDGDGDAGGKGKPADTPADANAPAAADAGTTGAAADPAEAAAPATQAETAAPAPAPAPAPAVQPAQQVASYHVDLPADFDDQLRSNKQAVAQARAKFNDGDLDQSELDAELERLQDERDQLRELQMRAKISSEMREQSEKAAWANTITSFMEDAAKNAELGIVDYRTDKAKQNDLDAMVRALASTPGNENKSMRWFLEEGHRRVVALHGIPTTKKAAADTRRKPDASAVVTNLADVPGGAGDADPVSDEFAELDKLQGLDAERALARMSEEKRAKYLLSV